MQFYNKVCIFMKSLLQNIYISLYVQFIDSILGLIFNFN